MSVCKSSAALICRETSQILERVCCRDVQKDAKLTRCDVSTCIWNCRLAVVLRSVLVTYSKQIGLAAGRKQRRMLVLSAYRSKAD
jgi:hypothetical protein